MGVRDAQPQHAKSYFAVAMSQRIATPLAKHAEMQSSVMGGGGLFEPRLGVNAPIYPSLLCTVFQQMDKRDRGDRCISGA